jgi:hypothetical protein
MYSNYTLFICCPYFYILYIYNIILYYIICVSQTTIVPKYQEKKKNRNVSVNEVGIIITIISDITLQIVFVKEK